MGYREMKYIVVFFLILRVGIASVHGVAIFPDSTDRTVGVGLLKVSMNRDIPLFDDAASTIPFDTLRFTVVYSPPSPSVESPSGAPEIPEIRLIPQVGTYLIGTTGGMDLLPYSYYEGNSAEQAEANFGSGLTYIPPELTFRVVEQQDSAYRIVLNEDTFRTAVVKLDPGRELYLQGGPYWNKGSRLDGPVWFLWETWDVYLRRLNCVNLPGNTVYDSPYGEMLESECR